MLKHIAIAVAIGVGGAAAASAGTLNIALDGACNTFALKVTTPFVGGMRSGCGYTVIDGGTVAKVSGVPYTITNDTNDSAEIFTWYFGKATHGAGSWMLYKSTGGASKLFNSGTYTENNGKSVSHAGKDVTQTR